MSLFSVTVIPFCPMCVSAKISPVAAVFSVIDTVWMKHFIGPSQRFTFIAQLTQSQVTIIYISLFTLQIVSSL